MVFYKLKTTLKVWRMHTCMVDLLANKYVASDSQEYNYFTVDPRLYISTATVNLMKCTVWVRNFCFQLFLSSYDHIDMNAYQSIQELRERSLALPCICCMLSFLKSIWWVQEDQERRQLIHAGWNRARASGKSGLNSAQTQAGRKEGLDVRVHVQSIGVAFCFSSVVCLYIGRRFTAKYGEKSAGPVQTVPRDHCIVFRLMAEKASRFRFKLCADSFNSREGINCCTTIAFFLRGQCSVF